MFTEYFATAKDIHKTNVMVSHHSMTAFADNNLRHSAEWIVLRKKGKTAKSLHNLL